jgi:hypothetical protein
MIVSKRAPDLISATNNKKFYGFHFGEGSNLLKEGYQAPIKTIDQLHSQLLRER